MAHRDATESPTFAAGFELARQLRNPAFRAKLDRLRCPSRDHILIAYDEEPLVDVLSRMLLHETGGRAVIAIPYPDEPFGFRLVGIDVAPGHAHKDVEPLALGPGASIGMIYTHLQTVASYMPNELVKTLILERV